MPSSRRDERRNRRPHLVHQQQQDEQPAIAVDFTQWFSPAEMDDVRAYADTVVPQLQARAAALYQDPEKQAHYLRKYAAGMALAAARALALADLEVTPAPAVDGLEADPAPAPAKQKQPKAETPPREPRRPIPGKRQTPGPWSPPMPKRRAAEEDESRAPVPAAPRMPQPTADQVLAMRPAKPPRRTAGGDL
jgi:hypothetical protein